MIFLLKIIAEFPAAQGAESSCLRKRDFSLLLLHYDIDTKLCLEFKSVQPSSLKNAHVFMRDGVSYAV